MQAMPSMDQLTGQQQPQAPQQGMQISPDMVKQAQMKQQPDNQAEMIKMQIFKMLKDKGFYDLPENKGRESEIAAEVEELVQAMFENDTRFVQQSEVYQFMVAQKGQRDAMRPEEQKMEMPDMEGMV